MATGKLYEWLVRPEDIKDRTKIRAAADKTLTLDDRRDIEALIDEEWRNINDNLRAAGSRWAGVSTPNYALTGYSVDEGGVLEVKLAPSEYKLMATTHDLALKKPEVFAKVRKAGKLPYTLGLSCAIESLDGLLVVFERSREVAISPGEYHVVGGRPRPERFLPPEIPASEREQAAKEIIFPERVNLFTAMAEEIEEEAGLSPEMYTILLAGIAHDSRILQPELIFCAQSNRTFDEISRLPKSGAWEGRMLGWNKTYAKQMARDKPDKFVRVAIAALDAHRIIYRAR